MQKTFAKLMWRRKQVMRSLVEHIYEMVQKQGNDYKNEYRN
jgi:hypothetical protein